ncbi:MAG: CoA transferase [Betaproteobacteria bacterium]|nr:CoA transferase [Betaproteobacteria bacterium]NBT11524.1 CoA transferase [Betaproteobacteria bacterium]NBU48946.1 CoA transferase [Betaproteobacteria bacterium]
MSLPLSGVTVLDLTQLLPGPLATRHLMEWGARVVKIEPPGDGDGARLMYLSEDDRRQRRPSGFFRDLNEGKQFLRLDLRSEEGKAQLRDRVRTADVLIEGFRPGVMQRLGLGWDSLRAVNPRLVMAAITGYGQQGPYAMKAGHDINYIALSGVLDQIGLPEGREPAVPNFQIADLLGGTLAAVSGLLAALVGAQRTGQGRFVDVSMTREVWRHAVIARAEAQSLAMVPARGTSLLNGGSACYGVYRCADGRHLAVGALEPKFWQAWCEGIGHPEWTARHWSQGEQPGSPQALQTRRLMAECVAQRPLDHWVAIADRADCCVSPVLRLNEVPDHPWMQGGG